MKRSWVPDISEIAVQFLKFRDDVTKISVIPDALRLFRNAIRDPLVCTALAFALMLSPANPALAQDSEEPLDIDYAEIQPLATESLLLNLTEASQGRLVAVGERGHVVLSDDRGETWRQAEVVPTRSTLTTVNAAAGRLWAAGHDTVIITSGDNGETWSRQYYDPERLQAVMHIRFSDARHGVAMGAYGLYLVTEDGGQTWVDEYVDSENEYHLNDMVLFGDGRRMIAGEAGYSYRSLDGGQTWEPLDLPYQGSMWGAVKAENDCVLMFGLRGHVQQSCDFGASWWLQSSGTTASLSDGVSDGGTVVLVGNAGTVLVREAGGDFQVYSHSSGVDFAAVLAIGAGRFILVGEDGTHEFPEPPPPGDSASAEPGSAP